MAKTGMSRPDVRDTHGADNKQAKEKRAETASVPEAQNKAKTGKGKGNPGK